ncbi:MAG: pyridoxamine 5'-phosphate oxidase family protein [Acidimicrobiales bacterium]
MSRAERQEFLAGLHVGVIAVTAGDRSLAVPIWYDYEPGGDVWIITGPTTIKGRALEETRRYSLCAQTEEPPYKYVTVEGPVTAIEQCPTDSMRAMARRYLGPEMGDAYAEAAAESGDSRVYRMTPEGWYTVDYSKDLDRRAGNEL